MKTKKSKTQTDGGWIEVIEDAEIQSAISKCKDCALEESAEQEYLAGHPHATQKMIAERIGKSERTVKTLTKSLQEKGLLARKNGKRNGIWEVLNHKEESDVQRS